MPHLDLRNASASLIRAVKRSDRVVKTKHHAALQRAAERKLHIAQATISRGRVATRQQVQQLTDIHREYSALLQAFNHSQTQLTALQPKYEEAENSLAVWQREYAALQVRLAETEHRASAAENGLNRACEQGRALEAQLAMAAQVAAPAAPSAATSTAPPPVASQVWYQRGTAQCRGSSVAKN